MSCSLRALIIADLSDRQNESPFAQEETEAQRDHLTSTLIGAVSWVTMGRSSFPWANRMPPSLADLKPDYRWDVAALGSLCSTDTDKSDITATKWPRFLLEVKCHHKYLFDTVPRS